MVLTSLLYYRYRRVLLAPHDIIHRTVSCRRWTRHSLIALGIISVTTTPIRAELIAEVTATTTATTHSDSPAPTEQLLRLQEGIRTAEWSRQRVLNGAHVLPHVLHDVVDVEDGSEQLPEVVRGPIVGYVYLVLLIRVTVVMASSSQHHLQAEQEVLQLFRQHLIIVLLVCAENVLDHLEVDEDVDDHPLAGAVKETRETE